jgi:hypothetical protein
MNLQQTAKQHPLIAIPLALATAGSIILSILLWASLYRDGYDAGFIANSLAAFVPLVTLLMLVAWFVTFLPGIIAWYRKHPSRVAVSWMCLLGWIPFIGWIFWIGLMFFAALSQTTRATPVAYGEGSIVNGHILLNGHWWPA